MYLCLCKGISDADVRQLGRSGVTTAEGIIQALGLRDEECCGNCLEYIDDFVTVANSVPATDEADLPILVAT